MIRSRGIGFYGKNWSAAWNRGQQIHEEKNMNKIINSPIVVAAFVVVSLFILKAQTKSRMAVEIRRAYEEIIAIAEEAGSDGEKSKAIQAFAEEIGTQIREGFQAGFSSTAKDKKESREEKFLRLKSRILISEPEITTSSQKNMQTFIYRITNNIDEPIKQVKVNYEYYRGDSLIDVENKWISEVKALAQGESIAVKGKRYLQGYQDDDELEAMKYDRVVLAITNFETIEE